jgi:glutathione peroxidase-family protein
LKRHDNLDHCSIFLKIENIVDCPLKEYEKQPSKKRPNISSNSISNFFVTNKLFKKDDVQQKQNLKDLGLLIIKNHLALLFVKSS